MLTDLLTVIVGSLLAFVVTVAIAWAMWLFVVVPAFGAPDLTLVQVAGLVVLYRAIQTVERRHES